MKITIQLMILIVCFIVMFKQYRRQPQRDLFVTLMALGLLGLVKGILPWIEIENEGLRYGCVMIALIGCVWSYYLIQKHEKK